VGFTDAIQDGFRKYVGFSGRSSRAAYWWWFLFQIIVLIVAYAISAAIGSLIIYYLAALALFLPSLAVGVRRLHDTGKTGWWILIGIIPFIGAIVLLVFYLQPSDPGPNQYGQAPDTAPAMA
jgi:uncharacterized membrane protein YhaH (DUF805 family)